MPSETNICNIALGKLGGAGDELGGNAFIGSIDGSDKVSSWCKLNFRRARRRSITDLATRGCPFRSTLRFADLGTGIAEGSLPETGEYLYAFALPGNTLQVVKQFDENLTARRSQSNISTSPLIITEYQWEEIASKRGNRKIFLTNILSNIDRTSAFIEYVIDTPATTSFSEEMIECIATLLAHGVAPVVGRDMESAAFMLQQYLDVAVPNAQAANQKDFNNSARLKTNYLGGRGGGAIPRSGRDLGTYVDAEGNRRDIF